MSTRLPRLVLAAAIAAQAFAVGCVQSRASRNGVFNENQYVRKDFLISQFGTTGEDPGWMLLGTITAVSTPNPLGDKYSLSPGIDSGQAIPFRFIVTEDKLQMVSTLEITGDAVTDAYNTPTVINAWPITNVDLQYQVNLDGETTNFYQENQERPWQQREFVKVQWDKNDMSDFAPMGEYEQNILAHCVDFGNVSSTLVPNSFFTEPPEASASTPVLTDPGASASDYMEWTINISLPLVWDDANCTTMYGQLGQEAIELNKQSETLNLKYSMIRAKPLPVDPANPKPGENTYVPLVVAEKDSIRHKYGFIDHVAWSRDPNSGVLAATDYVARFDPTKPIVWYFGQGFNPDFKSFYNGPGMIADQTNALLKAAGVAARVSFAEYNDPTGLTAANTNELANGRQYGDIRYNFLIWLNDGGDVQAAFAGVTEFATDPRTGESISSTIALSNFQIQDYYVQRIDAFLQSIGASLNVDSSGEWGLPIDPTTGNPFPASCVTGTTVPLVSGTVQSNLYAQNTVYQVMQTYLGQPASVYGSLGPSDFIVNQDADFYNAYFNLIRYEVFADPATNQYVTPLGNAGVFGASSLWSLVQAETQFQQAASDIDHGIAPFDVTADDGLQESLDFINNFRNLTLLHRQYQYAQHFANNRLAFTMDGADSLAFENVADHAARHCVNGAWETKEQWKSNLVTSYWANVAFHEFGHSLGLTHNFMGSVDKPNFPTYKDAAGAVHYADYASSVMEYEGNMARVFLVPQWEVYDKAAITWIYANNAQTACKADTDCGTSTCDTDTNTCNADSTNITGQVSATIPWKDPNGFTTDSSGNSTEISMLFCNENHLAYTPLCRQDDLGATPSEIIANGISSYEWQFQWRNFRQYQKIWNDSAYANSPAALFNEMRKFASLWAFDWSSGEIADTLRLIGVVNPDPSVTSNNNYYNQLTNKFNTEMSTANQLVAAYHEGMLEQSAGQRPYATKYDPFYGDVTQQGIILDKLFAMQGFVGLWATDNYDQNQAGSYIAYYEGFGDTTFNDIAKAAVVSMVGGGYAVYPYFVPTAVALFAQDTHSPSFGGTVNVRDWIGGLQFSRLVDMETYFQELAVQNSYNSGPGCPGGTCSCDSIATCNYDPTTILDPEQENQFVGPDKRRYIWTYVPDRNQYVVAQEDRNTVTYQLLANYNSDINISKDDGAQPGAAYGYELPIKYTLDSFTQFN